MMADNGAIAGQVLSTRVYRRDGMASALAALGLDMPRPVIVIAGGASGFRDEDYARLRPLFFNVLAPQAELLHAYVVDGGTDAGVMRLIGQARAALMGSFPLVGVVAVGTVPPPLGSASRNTALEPHHSHYVVVPGKRWMSSSPWMAQIATCLAAAGPSLTVIVNGGEVALQDVRESLKVGRRVLVVGGSGRTADLLAAALQDPTPPRVLRQITSSGLISLADLDEAALSRAINSALAAHH